MSRKRQPFKIITKISTKIIRRFLETTKRQIIWLLRTVFGTQKQQKASTAGFVLPTVAMVSVVVVLLTTAIMLRSFDKAKNASNVRINESVLDAATPGIDRGRAKINKLLQDKSLPRATPTDDALYLAITDKINEYTFGDETALQLEFDIDKDGTFKESTVNNPIPLYEEERVKTAWRFPVDTDNNGKFDSYTLYGILFRTPDVTSDGKYARSRNPLEARTLPMAKGSLDNKCGGVTSASLVGNTGWIRQDNKLKKAFFVYTATVPITNPPDSNYEPYKGGTGFAALEYQQDRIQIPPNNNAVVYEDDIELTPGPDFNLNGAVFTNSNFLTSSVNSGKIRFYQVSSKSSCYYQAENAKIIVGGNTALGAFISGSHTGSATVDLYKGKDNAIATSSFIRSVSSNNSPRDIAYNNLAYANRIKSLVNAQIATDTTGSSDPQDVKDGIEKKKKDLGLTSFTTEEFDKYRSQQLAIYFQGRTRRVPYTEVAFGATDTPPTPLLQTTDSDPNSLRPNDKWMYPTDPTDGKTGTNYTKITLNISGTSLEPKATEPKELKKNSGNEGAVGDRVIVGNNLPEKWWDKTKKKFVSSGIEDTQEIGGIKWDLPSGTKEVRARKSLVTTLADVGSTDRDGDWELDAAKVPQNITEPVGGLRVITGAGIYLNSGGTPASFDNSITEIWPDSYPVPQSPFTVPPKTTDPNLSWMSTYDATTKTIRPYSSYNLDIAYKWREIPADDPATTLVDESHVPFLQMRATAVYHYKSSGYKAQTPKAIACVSSFYVPTNSTTAKNQSTLPYNQVTNGLSNNGIVYPAPTKSLADYQNVLEYQATLKYPNGRLIDDGLLGIAIGKKAENRTISEQSAIDAQICALQIRYDSTFKPVTTNPVIDHGAIREITFLDSREVQQNSISGTSQTYDMPVKDRQPLEIRATVLDIDLLRKKSISGTSPVEYLLPNSGIIYATRDGALPDMSADTLAGKSSPTEANKSISPVDYRLDPTRRPGGIMLVNGEELGRTSTPVYREVEKGLILATNLPVYIKGDFNKHDQEEFTQALKDDWSNFYDRTTLNDNFACRKGDPRLPKCTTGDKWRPASVLADAVTLLSGNFREGFRDEGDYDWNNSLDSSLLPGFSAFNFFGANGTWADNSSGYPKDFDTKPEYQGSSYVNNFVTPLVRMIPARAYAFEICTSEKADECFCSETDTEAQCAVKTRRWVMTNVPYNAYKDNGQNSWRDGGINSAINSLETGFVGNLPEKGKNNKKKWGDLPFSRLAMKRDVTTTKLVTPLTFYGKGTSNKLEEFPLGGSKVAEQVSPKVLMPWLLPNASNVLEPVLQIKQPLATDTNPNNTSFVGWGNPNSWLQEPLADTTFNLIFAVGDSPARANGNNSEDNGGLHNFVRFTEHWSPNSGQKSVKISGAFMQVKKSAYATAPFATALSSSDDTRYSINLTAAAGTNGTATGYQPPNRRWGYDVALLSQSPDRFAGKLVLTPPDLPDEYFREVGRDDKWVSTLLCAKTNPKTNSKTKDDSPVYAINDASQRPDTCKS
jgi:hypothetical protein